MIGGLLAVLPQFAAAQTVINVPTGTTDNRPAVVTDADVPGGLEKQGGGTLNLLGANTYSTGTIATGGTIGAGHQSGGIIDALGTGSVTFNGGALRSTVTGELQNALVVNAGTTATISAAAGTTLTLTGTYSQSVTSAYVFGSTSDTGTIVFDAPQDGSTPSFQNDSVVIAGGTLMAPSSGATNLSSLLIFTNSVTVNAGATLDLNGQSLNISNLLGAGTVKMGTDPSSVVGVLLPSGTQTFSGTITGAGQLQLSTFAASATLILTGNNTYTGGTFICDCVTLQIGDGGTSGSIVGNVINGNRLVFNRSDTYVFDGVITDDVGFSTGRVLQNGTGTTILTNDSSYSNGTVVNAGMLVIGNGGTTGSIVNGVSVAAGATFGVNRSDVYILPNTVSGNGNFTQLGSGTTIFNTAQTYTGTTTVSAGTLQIGNGGTTGSLASLAIVDNATLAINKSNAFTLSAVVSGTGILNQIGGGTTSLGAANTYSGATNITAGTLRAGVTGAFSPNSAFNVGPAGTLNLSAIDQTLGSLTGSGAVLLSTATLTTGNDNSSTTYSGNIQGSGGLTKVGRGNFVLSGANTYTGATTINGGTLSINGTLASSGITVNSGGALGGTGTLPSTTINGGTLAPGNSIGTITIQGNLGFTSASFYRVETSATAADRTNVSGTATLGGATVQVVETQSPSFTRRTYTILNAAGGISGAFGAVSVSGLQPARLTYDANNVYLILDPGTLIAPPGASTNQVNVAGAINAAVASGATPPSGFESLLSMSNAQLLAALSQLSGETGAGATLSGFEAAKQFMNALFDHAVGDDVPAMQTGSAVSNYAAERTVSPAVAAAYAAVTPRSSAPRWSMWATGYGANAVVAGDGTTGSHNTTSRVYGLVAGADYRVTRDTRIGFAFGGAGTSFGIDSGLGSGRSDMFNAAIYGKHNWGAAYVAAALAYGWQDTTTDRVVSVSGTDSLHANFRANAFSGRLEAGRRFTTPMVGVVPYAAVQSSTYFLPAYSETVSSGGSQFALTYGSRRPTVTRGELGARFDKAMSVRDGVVVLKAKTAWAHDSNAGIAATPSFQALPGSSFVVSGANPSANAALLSLGAEMFWRNGWSLAANFDGEFSNTVRGYAGKGSVRYVW